MSIKAKLIIAAAVVLSLTGMGMAAWITPGVYESDLATPFPHREADWSGSNTCRACHPNRYDSWHRTFHRTMTQEATPQSVRGAFDNRRVTYLGRTIRPVIRDGRYYFDYLDPKSGHVTRSLEILRTVGSRRYQQYLTQLPGGGDTYYRLQILWHIEDQRWVHMNGVFLGPDSNPYDTHFAVWNHNCIMCHNTGPEPRVANYEQIVQRIARGERVNSAMELTYASRVAELGISCGSCHGPGSEHTARNRNPLRRYLLHFTGRDDPTIVNPAKLDKERSAEVCGQCHGQRLPRNPDMIQTWMRSGPTYRAGEDLDDHVNLVQRDTTPLFTNHAPEMFQLRFWGDGTPRLTAYEYQGLRQSPCFQSGELTCISCHSMHGGDVHGQLPPEHRTHRACTGCHEDIAANIPAHTFHAADSAGSDCFSCHMPKMVYGIMEIHRSHRIENPDPARDAQAGRPSACTSCHLDRSLNWAADSMRTWWGEGYRMPEKRLDEADLDIADIVASLLGGDPVQRAVAARLAGRNDTPLTPQARAFVIPHLLTAMQNDSYPAVRRFAHKSLLAIEASLASVGIELGFSPDLAAFDFIGPVQERGRIIEQMWARWAALPKDQLPKPVPGMLLDASYQPLRAEIRHLAELAERRTQEVSIGE